MGSTRSYVVDSEINHRGGPDGIGGVEDDGGTTSDDTALRLVHPDPWIGSSYV